jgi:subtilisin family serine protease
MQTLPLPSFACGSLTLAAFLLVGHEAAQGALAQPWPAGQSAGAAPQESTAVPGGQRLVVKFRDEWRVRANFGLLTSHGSAELERLNAWASQAGLRFRPLIQLPEQALLELEARAAARSGVPQPDLAGHLILESLVGPQELPLERLGAWAAELEASAAVEWTYLEHLGVPPPGDIPPVTPNLEPQQTYLGPNPGVDALYAWGQLALGAGVRISDCEYGWNPAHEDLVDINTHPEPGQTIPGSVFANGWDQHGTAVLGQLVAPQNGYGITGMARQAEVYTYPEWSLEQGLRRVTAITNAILNSVPGDVVLLEMQQTGPGGGFGPAELDPAVFNVVRTGVAAGVIVVGAAGNGNQNLDSAPYAGYMAQGNSGAILVGAGSNDTGHNKLSFSTYGSRVDVQAWGQNVLTLGYGSAFTFGGDNNQKYSYFSGTSSASPFVAAGAAVISSLHQQYLGSVPSPAFVRNLLVSTGIPQGTGGKIGPALNLQAAINALGIGFSDLGFALPGSGNPRLNGSGVLAFGTPFGLQISGGPALASGALVIGLSRVDLPLAGGLLVPSPDVLVPVQLDANGSFSLTKLLNANQAGLLLYQQAWLLDSGAVAGLAATNAVQAQLH